MSDVMSNTLLSFGLFCVVAAIVGGGLKALGFTIGSLQSTTRQILLCGAGIVVIGISQNKLIGSIVFPPKPVVVGPVVLPTGTNKVFPLNLHHGGRVEVTLQNLVPDFTGFKGPRHQPGQDGLYLTLCGSAGTDTCISRQMGEADTVAEELSAGAANVSVFNFATNPTMNFTLRISRPD